ncbi:MAG: siderophore-interacting protein [Myxococcota bacterium]
MPELPGLLADLLEPRFAREARVVAIEELTGRFRRVRFAGEALRGVAFRPGQEIEFRVTRTAFRHYTPAAFDPVDGTVDVVFFVHGLGPGSAWSSALTVGQPVRVLGPGGRFGLRDARRHIFVGDETTLGLFTALQEGSSVDGTIEVGADESAVISELGLALSPSVRSGAERGRCRFGLAFGPCGTAKVRALCVSGGPRGNGRRTANPATACRMAEPSHSNPGLLGPRKTRSLTVGNPR